MEVEKQKGRPSGSKALKKMIPQLLISVSLFSFVLSYSSLSSSSLSSSSSSSSPKLLRYFSAANYSSFHLLSKNCLFLICNGLLVFLSKTSGFISPGPHDLNDVLHFRLPDTFHRYDDNQNADDGGKKNPEQVSIFIAESDDHEDVKKNIDDQNQPDSSSCWLFDDDHGDHLYGHHDEEGGDDDDEAEMMSTEELNQKFEDFIRKMKEEIIINEATHKLLLLN